MYNYGSVWKSTICALKENSFKASLYTLEMDVVKQNEKTVFKVQNI